MSSDIIQEGDAVVLYFSISTVILVPSIKADGVTHNAWGYFGHGNIIGKAFGSKVFPCLRSENPRPVHVLPVTAELFTLSIPHRTQIIYHADITAIVAGLNILPGAVVAEAGTGSASLSYSIADIVAPTGCLFTFDVDPSRVAHNVELLSQVSSPGVVKVELRDVIRNGFPSDLPPVDAVFLDLPSPWLVVSHAKQILKENGRICTFSPAIEQVTKNVHALCENGFHQLKTVEVMLKPWGLDKPELPGTKRKRDPAQLPSASFQLPMRGHTSYLTFAVKGLVDEGEYPKPVLSVTEVRKLLGSAKP